MKNTFSVGVAKLLSSKMASQIINLLTAPVILRLYKPDHFGIRQLFISIQSVAVAISCLRYEISIPLRKNKAEMISSLSLSVFVALIFSLVTFVIVFISKSLVVKKFNAPELDSYLWALPFIVFINGSGNALRYYASALNRFGTVAISDFFSIFGGVIITIAWAFILKNSFIAGLFIGHFFGIFFGILFLVIFLINELLSDIKKSKISLASMWTSAKDYKKFPIFDTWSTLLNTVSIQLPVIILGLFSTPQIVGYYSQSQRFIGVPMSMLGGSIAQVFFPLASKEYNEKSDISGITGSTFKRLIQISLFPMMTIAFIGPTIFSFVFGQEWHDAGIYAQILSAYFLFDFIFSPMSSVFDILQRQGTIMIFNMVLIIGRISSLLIGIKLGGPIVALAFFSLISLIIYLIMCIWILRKSLVSLKNSIKAFLLYALSSCLLLPAFFASIYGLNIFFIIVLTFLAYVGYFWFLYASDSSIRNYIKSYVLKFGRSPIDISEKNNYKS